MQFSYEIIGPLGEEGYKVKYKVKAGNIGPHPLYKKVLPLGAFIETLDWLKHLDSLGNKKLSKIYSIVHDRIWWQRGIDRDSKRVITYAANACLYYIKKHGVEI